jgi:hypothetical protein
MSSKYPILWPLRGRSSVSLPDPSRFSLSLAPNGPFNTPIIPSIYITGPEEDGNVTWCAIDGDTAFSLDVPLPDIALLERTIDGLRKATTSAASHTSMFRRPNKRDSAVLHNPVQDESEDDLSGQRESQILDSQVPRQHRVVFADTNGRVHLERFPQRPRSALRVHTPPPTVLKVGSLRMRASKVLQVLKPRRLNTSPPSSALQSQSENRSATPASFHVPNGLFGSSRLRKGVSLIFKRSDPAPQPAVEEMFVDSLGIYTPSPPQHSELACPSLTPPTTPMSPDKPLPPLPAHDPTSDAACPTLRNHQSNPALSPPKPPKRRFSLTDLRQKWMQTSRTDSPTSTADDSIESSGSSAAVSSIEQDESRPISRSPGRRMIIESMHFPDLNLRFDETSF